MDAKPRMRLWHIGTHDPGLQLQHLLREFLRGVAIGIEQLRRARVTARGAPHAQINAPGRQRLQHPELLGHLEWRVMRQHHAGAADANARGPRGDGRHQHLGRTAHDGGVAVVLADPETVVAQSFAILRQGQRFSNGCIGTAPRQGHGLVKYGKFQGTPY
jgi:hypothetical protein